MLVNKRLSTLVAVLCCLILLDTYSHAQPVPARDEIKVAIQPDGTHVPLYLFGDERFSWLETKEGYVVIRNKKTRYYEYASIGEVDGKKQLLPSGNKVSEDPYRKKSGSNFLPLKREDIIELRRAIKQ